MKKILLTALFFVGVMTSSSSYAAMTGTYGLHLFFNEREYIDILRIAKMGNGQLTGDMIVPNDFNGKLKNVRFNEMQMTFDLFVPKNSARPKDMIFNYRLLFFDQQHNQFIGFVTIQGQPGFAASFVGFKRSN